jgi:hypothetical protein
MLWDLGENAPFKCHTMQAGAEGRALAAIAYNLQLTLPMETNKKCRE